MRLSSTLPAQPGALPLEAFPFPPGLAIALLLAAVVGALIYAHQPPVPQTMAIAFLPWVVAGSLLHVVAVNGQYPPYLVPLVTVPGAYLTALLVPGVVWSAILNVSLSRRALPAYHHYIGTMGTGVAVVLWIVLLVDGSIVGLSRLLLLLIVPLVAFLAAGLVSLFVGLWSPDFVMLTPYAGGFVVLAALVNGVASALAAVAGGSAAHTIATTAALELVLRYAPGGLGPIDVSLLWVSLFLVSNVLLGVAVATGLARHASARPRAVHSLLGLVGVVWFGLGFNRLLVAVVS